MQFSKLGPRTRLSIEMALAGDRGPPALIRQQDDAAARLGMCGAAIDAARAGRSFDVRGGRALELALAVRRSDYRDVRSRAVRAGFDDDACREIEGIAAAHASGAEANSRGSCCDYAPGPTNARRYTAIHYNHACTGSRQAEAEQSGFRLLR